MPLLFQHLECKRIQFRARLGACRVSNKTITGEVAQDGLGKDGPCRVACANEQDVEFSVGHLYVSVNGGIGIWGANLRPPPATVVKKVIDGLAGGIHVDCIAQGRANTLLADQTGLHQRVHIGRQSIRL